MTTAAAHDLSITCERKKIRVNGEHSLADVARSVCGDVRLAPLVHDLNPSLAPAGLLPAGSVVVCPGAREARGFARRMGFTVGFDPEGANGTAPRRKWNLLQGPGAAREAVDVVALARSMTARGVSPVEAGRRIARDCGLAEIQELARADEVSVRQVGRHAEAAWLYPRASSRVTAIRAVLDATVRPGGLRALLLALARDPNGGRALLTACAVAPALRAAIVDDAPRVAALLERARALAELERGLRDAKLSQDACGRQLRSLVDAIVDGVEPLAGERIELVGIAAEADALNRHLEMLRGALRQAEQGLGRAPIEVLRAFALGEDASTLPRPWSLLGGVCRELGRALDARTIVSRDAGLGGLLGASSCKAGGTASENRVTVAELQVRAAACARAADEGDGFVERLAPVVCELFDFVRPNHGVDGGAPHVRRARRRADFERETSCRQGGIRADGVVTMLHEVLERARSGGHPAMTRVGRAQTQALEQAARALIGPMTVHRRPVSETGRALVLAAMALDPHIAQGLSRPTGREALVAAATKHAGRVLSAASCRIVSSA